MCLHKIQFDALINDDVHVRDVRDVLQRNSEIAAMGMLLSDANDEDMVVSRVGPMRQQHQKLVVESRRLSSLVSYQALLSLTKQ